jgi:outer membrane protein OmpA-like peptidoglycan-associated protein
MAERKPFLHPDGKSLYFASEGHPGLGRLDLFVAKRLSDTSWAEWSEPVNFGKQVNTSGNERAALVNTVGKLSYFAADNRGLNFGGTDIYSMDVPRVARPDPVYVLEGKVVDTEGFPIEAEIVWEDLETGERIGSASSNPQDGSYYLILQSGQKYGFFAEKEGFFPLSENIDLSVLDSSSEVTKDIVLYRVDDLLGDDLEMAGSGDLLFDEFKLKRRKKIKMNNLFFDYNKSSLLKSSYSELKRVAIMLEKYDISLVEVSGHTDSIGSVDYNKKLSERRAGSVKNYLVSKGVQEAKLVSKGYSPDEPVATNETEEGRALIRASSEITKSLKCR